MMRPGQDLCVLVLCVFSIYWSCVLAARKYDKPEITSEFETVIETNDNHTVFCQGNDPLNWRWPEVEEEFQFWTTFITTRETPVDKNYKYGLRLQIINMTYPFVGFYYCHYENANLEDELNSAKIYLFVNDPDHLTLLKDNGAFNTYTVTQFTEAVIPCKPTSPDVQVLLLDYNDGKELPLDGVSDTSQTLYRYDPLYGFLTNDTIDIHRDRLYECVFLKGGQSNTNNPMIEDTTYDPKTGFTFFVSDLDQQQIYQCNFSRHSATAVILVFLTVEPYQYISDLPLPYIQDLNEGHTIVGKPLVLECIIKTRNQVFFHWSTPSGDINEKRMRTSSRGKTDKTYGVLTIANATKADNGTYSCNVTDNQDHSAYTSLDVRVFDINESFLSVKEENDVHSLTAPAGEDEVHWIIRVEGHPRPTVNWFNNRNTTIRMENDEKYQAYYNATYNTALLKIKKLAISDFGTYTLRVTNKKEEKILPLFLNVTDKPTVVIDTEPFYFINTPSKVKCIAYANPEPQFEWSFKPCLSRDCQFGPVEKIVTEGEGFVFTSVITISNATESGHIRCRARNSVGFNQAFKGFFVSDIKNGFDIIIKNSDVDVDEEQKVATVAEDETVSMACGAAKLNYSDIALFWNNQPLTNYYNTFSVTNSSTQYSTKLELELEHMNKSNSGSLSCRVKDKNGGYLYRNMTFTVATPVPPAIVNTTLKEKLEIDLAEKLVLYCRVSGIPKPSLLWYKNGVVFNPPESTRLKVSADNEKITFWPTLAQDEGTYRCEAKNKKGTAYKQQTVKFKNLPRAQGWLIIVIVLLSLVSVAAIIFIIIKTRKEKAVLPPASNMGDYRANNSDGPTATDMTTISQGEEGVTLSNNSVQPEWRSNYKGDYKGNVKPICTKDLLIWAFQVARGMEYRMMTECWATKPLARPSFTKLVERLGTLMDDTLKKYYIELNDPYLVMNTQRLQEGQSDYLAMLSPPTFEAICSPHYVNDVISQESLEDSGYLSMKPNTIFSPRVEEGEVFDFNVNNRKNTNSTEGNTMELVPMLQRRDSGCETPLQSPATPNSVSNPSYHLPPNIPEEDRAVNTDIVKSPDNYVNMLQSKSIVKEKNSGQINPFADSNNGNGNLHYVNCS
ncbi:hypothetical protein NQ315_007667 [Exocentrus adspersus]|uniref:Ig-like domain-containing protein n=1 Tax=Exocentrus adspersus TaxID=1586481 RepID=A0AAV8W8A5_9CUCU|nr:hypothetical protein NQ315_007667 [Exocentrus adspersus]